MKKWIFCKIILFFFLYFIYLPLVHKRGRVALCGETICLQMEFEGKILSHVNCDDQMALVLTAQFYQFVLVL